MLLIGTLLSLWFAGSILMMIVAFVATNEELMKGSFISMIIALILIILIYQP